MRAANSPSAQLLALADQRLPSGGHAHSGAAEEAVERGLICDERSLSRFLSARLSTVGLTGAALAAAAVGVRAFNVSVLDAEADARMPSHAARETSRVQGRSLLRVARTVWAAPSTEMAWSDLGARPHHPIVLGCCAAAAGLSAFDAALVAAYQAVTGPATAAQRLLAMDPIAVAVVTMQLAADIERVADAAATAAAGAYRDLPDTASYVLDLLIETHASREDRLFAS